MRTYTLSNGVELKAKNKSDLLLDLPLRWENVFFFFAMLATKKIKIMW